VAHLADPLDEPVGLADHGRAGLDLVTDHAVGKADQVDLQSANERADRLDDGDIMSVNCGAAAGTRTWDLDDGNVALCR